MDDGGRNRRAHERLRLPLEAQWEGQSGRHEARVYDLSPGGCYIESIGQVTDGERDEGRRDLRVGRLAADEGVEQPRRVVAREILAAHQTQQQGAQSPGLRLVAPRWRRQEP